MQSLGPRCPSCAPVQSPRTPRKGPILGKQLQPLSLAQITLFCAPAALDYFLITSFRSSCLSSLLVGKPWKGRHSALLMGVCASPHPCSCHQASQASLLLVVSDWTLTEYTASFQSAWVSILFSPPTSGVNFSMLLYQCLKDLICKMG